MTRHKAIELLKKGEAKFERLKKAELLELCAAVGITPRNMDGLKRTELIQWITGVVVPQVLGSEEEEHTARKLDSKIESLEETCKRLGIPFKDMTEECAGQTTIILIPHRQRDPVELATKALTDFPEPDVEFIAVLDRDQVVFQIGFDVFSQFEDMDSDGIIRTAEKMGYFEFTECGYIDEHGVVDVEKCRQDLIEEEQSANITHATHTYPCGRAFDYFERLSLKIPADIDLRLFEWGHMSPLYVAAVPNPNSVVRLQQFLAANGVKANFTFARSWEVWGL